jgi:sugar lactone lactonase YvrE
VTLGPDGSFYIADTMNHRVRRIAPDGTISTFAGTGVSGFSGDGGRATAAQFFLPAQTLFDSAGNLYISDYGNSRVRVVSPAGIVSTVAGNGLPDPPQSLYTQTGDGAPALHATFTTATSAAFGPAGDLYVADREDSRIRRIAPDGTVTTFAGTGVALNSGDGGPAIQAEIYYPITVATDNSGTVYFETGDSRVRKVTADGIIHLVAGTGTGTGSIRSGGDGGPAVNATLSEPKGLAIDTQGNVYIGDTSNARLRKVDTHGIITTIAGPGVLGTDYWNAVAFDPLGNLYVAITHTGILDGLFYSVIDRVNPDGTLTPVAGNAQTCENVVDSGFRSDGIQATQAPLCVIVGLTFDAQGAMYIPEAFYGAVLKVSLDGTIRRVVGSNTNNLLGDGGPPLLANLQGSGYYAPSSIAFDANGDMFIPSGTRIREVIPGLVTAQLSKDRIDFQGASPPAQSILVATNIAEPIPFAVQVKNAGTWLSTNRPTGQTGDLLTVSANATGLAPGIYSATIQISIPGGGVGATLPVTLTVQ